jgi:hypothetical protein
MDRAVDAPCVINAIAAARRCAEVLAGLHSHTYVGVVGDPHCGADRSGHGTIEPMLIATFALLITIIGLLVYVLASNAKVVELGRITFACGMLVTVFIASKHVVKLW